MSHLSSVAVLPEASMPVELRGKLCNRFYEPIVLLLALTKAFMYQHVPKVVEDTPEVTDQTPQQLFHDFMNKLALICDNKKWGSTVTAAVALKYPDRVQYRFASNDRKTGELPQIRAFIEDILNFLKSSTGTDQDRHKILRKIISVNRPRLQIYVRVILAKSKECLEAPEGSITIQSREKLEKLQELSLKADNRGHEEPEFFMCCAKLMSFIKSLSKSEAYRVVRDKANAENGHNTSWGALRHATGRLLAYFQCTKSLFQARKMPGWDCLFHEFEVVWLPSSTPLSNPISRKSVTAEDIIGRMTWDQGKAAKYKDIARGLQQHQLDEYIQEKARDNKNFRPIVHAEILLHESIVNDPDLQNLHPTNFFNSYKYIGCSKPTCRLCSHYFAACADGIQIRRGHGNLYAHWRAPNVYRGQGDEAVKRREDNLNKMLVPIREEVFRTLDDKKPTYKRFDSNTDPTYNLGTSIGYVNGEDRGFSVGMEELSVRDDMGDDHATRRKSRMEPTEADGEDESYQGRS